MKLSSMKADVFNLLHDGSIYHIEGNVPGEIRINVDCGYLRTLVNEVGDSFILRLRNCQKFVYLPYKDEGFGSEVSQLSEISKHEPDFVTAEQTDLCVSIYCSKGVIQAQFSSISVWLNTETEISFSDLELIVNDYWAKWKEKNQIK